MVATKKNVDSPPKKIPSLAVGKQNGAGAKAKQRKSDPSSARKTEKETDLIEEEKQSVKKPSLKRKPRQKGTTKKISKIKKIVFDVKNPSKARGYFILFLGAFIVFIYGLLVEGGFTRFVKENNGIVIVFLFFIFVQFILIFIGYQLGLSKNQKKKKR